MTRLLRRLFARRAIRLLLAAVVLLAAAAASALAPRRLVVVLYNDTDQPFQRVEIAVGPQQARVGPVAPRESIALRFHPPGEDAGIRLFLDADPPMNWNAPGLPGDGVSIVTLRVDAFGGVTATAEPSLWRRFSKLFD